MTFQNFHEEKKKNRKREDDSLLEIMRPVKSLSACLLSSGCVIVFNSSSEK